MYITGTTGGSLGGAYSGPDDAWVAKYDSSGTQQWIRQLGILSASYGVAVDNSGNVYISGEGMKDPRFAKFDSNGNLQWSERWFRTSYEESASDIAVDVSGNVYMTGSTLGSLGGTNVGGRDGWVAKYDSSGMRLWTRQLGTFSDDDSYSVAVDSLSNVYITGTTNGSLGGTNAGGADAWIAKYDSSGTLLWKRQLGTAPNDDSYGITVDSFGDLYITGTTYGSLGGTNAGGTDAWVAKYDSSGTQLWKRQLGTNSGDDAVDVAVDNLGNVYISGTTYGSLGGTKTGISDAWVAKYDRSGTQQWIKQLGTPLGTESRDVVVDNSGSVYITGLTYGSLEGTQAGGGDVFLAKYSNAPVDDTLSTARNLGTLIGTQTFSNFVGDADIQDYYRFSVDVKSDLRVLLNGLSANANLELLDSSGIPLLKSQNTGNVSDLITTTVNPGTYYLRVYSGGTDANTNYTMNITGTPSTPPDTVGNDINSALDLGNLNGTRTFREFVGDADPYDYYRFSLSRDSQFSLLLNGLSATGTVANPDVTIFSQNSDGIFSPFGGSTVVNGSNTIDNLLLSGTYIVRVGNSVGVPINSNYNLTLNATVFDAGNTPSTARNIGILTGKGSRSFKEEIGNSDLQDYYRFYLPNRSDVKLNLSNLNSAINVEVLKDESGTLIPIETLTGQQNIADLALLLTTGIYYLRVAPTSSNDSTNYDLNVSWASREPRDLKINFGGTYGSGKDIYVTGEVYDPDGFSDLDRISLRVAPEGGISKEYTITNFTPSSTDSRWAEFSYNLGRVAPGTYGWAATAYDKSGSVSDTTIASNSVVVVYSPEDNAGDIPSQAYDIGTLSGTHRVSDFVGTTDSDDWYRFTVPSSSHFTGTTNVKIRLDGLNGDADISMLRLNSDGTTIWWNGSSSSGSTPEVLTEKLPPGTYFLKVSSGGIKVVPSNPNTNYVLTVSIPTVETINPNQTISGTLSNADPQDSIQNSGRFYKDYRLTGFTPGQKVKLTLGASGFRPHLQLVQSSTGQLVGQSVSHWDVGTELEFVVPSDWNNTVRVTSLEQNGIGSFTLTPAPVVPNFAVGIDSNGNNYVAFNTAAQYYKVAGNPTSAVYRSGNGYIQEFYAADGFGKYFLMQEDGSDRAYLLGGAPLEHFLNNGDIGRFGYPISEVVVDGGGGPSRQYFRKSHFMIYGGEKVYSYDGSPSTLGNAGSGSSSTNRPQSDPKILNHAVEQKIQQIYKTALNQFETAERGKANAQIRDLEAEKRQYQQELNYLLARMNTEQRTKVNSSLDVVTNDAFRWLDSLGEPNGFDNFVNVIFDKIPSWVYNVWGIGNALRIAKDNAKGAFNGALSWIKGKVNSARTEIKNAVSWFIDALKNVYRTGGEINSAIEELSQEFKGRIDAQIRNINNGIDGFKTEAIKNLGGLRNVGVPGWNFYDNLVVPQADNLVSLVKVSVGASANSLKGTVDYVKPRAQKAVAIVVDAFFGDKTGNLYNKINGIDQQIAATTSAVEQKIVQKAVELKVDVDNWLNKLANDGKKLLDTILTLINSPGGQIGIEVVKVALGFVPIVGQAIDVIDTAVALWKFAIEGKRDTETYIELLGSLAGWFPGVGDAIKGVAKIAFKGPIGALLKQLGPEVTKQVAKVFKEAKWKEILLDVAEGIGEVWSKFDSTMDEAAGWILDLMPGVRPALAGVGDLIRKFSDDAANAGDSLDGISKTIAKKIDDTSEQIAKEDKGSSGGSGGSGGGSGNKDDDPLMLPGPDPNTPKLPSKDHKERIYQLGYDPVKKQFSQAEQDAALRLEQKIKQELTRSPHEGADWIDQQGKTYDAVGPLPNPNFFKYGSFTDSINAHLLKDGLDYVVVDITGVNSEQRNQVINYINRLSSDQIVRVIVQG